jgi:hypothetical protein
MAKRARRDTVHSCTGERFARAMDIANARRIAVNAIPGAACVCVVGAGVVGGAGCWSVIEIPCQGTNPSQFASPTWTRQWEYCSG